MLYNGMIITIFAPANQFSILKNSQNYVFKTHAKKLRNL